MPGFYLYSSNDQNALVKSLASRTQTPLSNPLEPEIIVVQSQGMQRWISLRIADILGIFANVEFLFPNELIRFAFQKVIPDMPEKAPLDRDTLLWQIMEILPDCLKNPDFQQLELYLTTGDQIKLWQLAQRIASIFDQYTMFRPDMILDWEDGKKQGWQAELWRKVRDKEKTDFYPHLRRRFFESVTSIFSTATNLPERIFIFGISSLPPLHIEVITELSKYMDVHLYFLNPSQEYWSDISSGKEIARMLNKVKDPNLGEEALHLDVGNSLLASLGRTGRNFFRLLMETEYLDFPNEELFVEPGEATALETIRNDLFYLLERGIDQVPVKSVDPDDHSIRIHSCHSRMREIEVLYDQLLNIMEGNPEVRPGDILVMAPNIDDYVPLIGAVFSGPVEAEKTLPFSIADRSFRQESKVTQYFFQLLELSKNRFGLSVVLDLLESESIRAKFDLSVADVDMITHWMESSNIRWGVDEKHRGTFDIPETWENTWAFGLQRLLLGYAMPDHEGRTFEGILPYNEIEGSDAQVLGRFVEFFNTLKGLVKENQNELFLDRARSLTEWGEFFSKLLDSFFINDEEWEDEFFALTEAFRQLKKTHDKSEFNAPVEFDVIKEYLTERVEEEIGSFGFLGAGVTFCSMLPMRSIPFKVIALLGMNEKDYPRVAKPVSFDLMAKSPKLGDRSLKDDDRYLFLETMLSAREFFHLSYVGQSIKDNSLIPPSTLISELIYYLEQAFVIDEEEKSTLSHFLTRHPLQAFSPLYFQSNDVLHSYSLENFQAAQVLKERTPVTPDLFLSNLPKEKEEEVVTVELNQLVSFFSNPARHFLTSKLGLYLGEEKDAIDENEPFDLNSLERYLIRQELVEALLTGQDPELIHEKFRAKGVLPLRMVGTVYYKSIFKESEEFVEKVKNEIGDEKLPPLSIDLSIEKFRLIGTIQDLWSEGLIHFRCAKIKPKDRLRIWIEQLSLTSSKDVLQADGVIYPQRSVLIGNEKSNLYCEQIPSPKGYLLSLLKLYEQGQQNPLPFFPKTAFAYLETLGKSDPEKAVKKAESEWIGNDFKSGERDSDPYFRKCFLQQELFDTGFDQFARTVLEPLLEFQLARK